MKQELWVLETDWQPIKPIKNGYSWLTQPWLEFCFSATGQSDVQYEENTDIKMSEVANTKILYQQCSVANIPHVDYEHCLQISPCSSGCESFSTSGC